MVYWSLVKNKQMESNRVEVLLATASDPEHPPEATLDGYIKHKPFSIVLFYY